MNSTPAIGTAVTTVAQNTATQKATAAQNATADDVNNTSARVAAASNDLAVSNVVNNGDHSVKEIRVSQAQMDIKLSSAELAAYDGEISFNNIELHATTSLRTAKEAELVGAESAADAAKKQAETTATKSTIKTSINANGEAEFVTHSGMKIVTDVNKGGNTTKIYNAAGELLMNIEGDPHVAMLKDGGAANDYDFHFGDDSTLKFEDGTEVTFNTTETGKDTGIFYTTGIYVKAGDNVMHTGETTDGQKRTDIAQVDANSYTREGSKAKGAVTMGLKGDGQILMQTGDNQWNELKDESWDGYLKDKTFDNQKGAAVDFKPETIGSSSADNKAAKEAADKVAGLKADIAQLKKKEAGYESKIAGLTPLKQNAESKLDQANHDYQEFSAMDETDPRAADTEANRKAAEQKSLELAQRANGLGLFMATSSIASPKFNDMGVKVEDFTSGYYGALRQYGSNNIDFNDRGLQPAADRDQGTQNLINKLYTFVENNDFEEKSLQNDQAEASGKWPTSPSSKPTN